MRFVPRLFDDDAWLEDDVSQEDFEEAIQEFEDNAFHSSLQPDLSEQAKAIALRSMVVMYHFFLECERRKELLLGE